jgi:excisionase family DNA binding protein
MASLLTVRKAAERMGVGYSTFKQWIYRGTIRTVRTGGGHHRVPETEVERLLASQGKLPRASRRSAPTPGVLVALSGRNQLRGIVEEVRVDGLLAQVRLRIGDQHLTAVITRDGGPGSKFRVPYKQ